MWSSSRSSSTHNKHTTTESGVSHPDSYYHWALGGIDRHSPRMLWAVMGQQVKTLFAFLMVAGAASMAGSSAALLITGMHSKNPLHPPSSKAAPVVLTTCADGPEGFVLVKAMLDTPTARSGMIRVVGGVESLHSLEALELQMLGVQVRAMEPLSPDVFDGVDWAFILAPLSRDRLKRGTMMIDAAVAAGVSQAILLSVIGAGTCGERNASKLWQYWALEQTVHERFGPGGVVLRTYFYQQNLAFWAEDAVATGGSLRLPLRNHTGFCPLHQKDVAAVAAEIAKNHNVRPDHAGQTFNLTGPESLNGRELAMVASDAIGRPMEYRDVGRREAMAILDATGQLDRSESELLLELLELQPVMCESRALQCPSIDVAAITGVAPRPTRCFFEETAGSFRWRVDQTAEM